MLRFFFLPRELFMSQKKKYKKILEMNLSKYWIKSLLIYWIGQWLVGYMQALLSIPLKIRLHCRLTIFRLTDMAPFISKECF